MTSAALLLKMHNLKSTKLRLAVVQVLMDTRVGLSHQDLSNALTVEFDRVTLFRTLNTFEDIGIVHKIMDAQGTAKYAYTLPNDLHNNANHAHFICSTCGQIFCLNDTFTLNDIAVPEGFTKNNMEVQVKGICNKCNN
jgi:Fur family ferric uptake transcriptional regulator